MVSKSPKIPAHAWGFNASKEQPQLLRAWDLFIRTGKIETKVVPPHIAVAGADLVQYPHAESIAIAASTAIENLLELDRAKRELFIYSESLQITIDFGCSVFPYPTTRSTKRR